MHCSYDKVAVIRYMAVLAGLSVPYVWPLCSSLLSVPFPLSLHIFTISFAKVVFVEGTDVARSLITVGGVCLHQAAFCSLVPVSASWRLLWAGLTCSSTI